MMFRKLAVRDWILLALVLFTETGFVLNPYFHRWFCWPVYVWPVIALVLGWAVGRVERNSKNWESAAKNWQAAAEKYQKLAGR